MKVPVYCWRSSFARPNPGGFIMRFLTATAASYVGVDLHARTLFVCVLDQAGAIKLSRNLPAKPQPFLNAVEPFLPDLVVGCECMHSWYWLADTCRERNITSCGPRRCSTSNASSAVENRGDRRAGAEREPDASTRVTTHGHKWTASDDAMSL